MAVFLINICKFDGCGITFPSLSDLIQHIEDTHIDYDPKVVEQKELAQPTSLPLSYVLRFVAADAPKEGPFIPSNATGADMKRKLAIKHHSYSMSSSNRSNTPTGSEMDEEDMVVSESDDSNDSWTTEEFSSEFIMRYGSRHSGTGTIGSPGNEKPFACPVPGCKKRYKNVNGIKYHSKNGHKKDGKVKKGYKCTCGKSYKTSQGLKNHAHAAHNTSSESIIVTQHVSNGGTNGTSSGILMQRSTSPSQRSIGSLSPSSISNMSSSASSCHGGSSTMTNGNSCSGSGNNSNIQHQVTNGISCGAGVNGGGQTVSATNSGNNIIQQQQFNTTATSSNQLNIAPAPAHSHPPTPTSASISVGRRIASNGAVLLRNTPSPVGSTNRHRNRVSAAANLESSSIMNISHTNTAAVAELRGRGIAKHSVAPAHAKFKRVDVRNIGNSVPSYASYRPSLVSFCPSAAAVAPNSVSDGDAVTRYSTRTPPAAADVASMVGYAHPSPIAQPSYPVAAAMTPAVDNEFPVSMGQTLSPLAKGIDGSVATPTSISPTFIEHKYSANTLKKQFYANMNRNNYNSSNTAKRATDTNHLHGGDKRTEDSCKRIRLVNVGCKSRKN